MATTEFRGSIDGNWGTAGNWTNGVPGANDTALVTAETIHDIDTGLTPGATDLALFYIAKGATVNVGLPGAPLTLDADKVINRGIGTFHYEIASDTGEFQRYIIDAPLPAKTFLSGADADSIELVDGHLTLTANMVSVALLNIGGGSLKPIVDIVQGCGTISIMVVDGGQTALYADVSTLVQSGGLIEHRGTGIGVASLYLNGGRYELHANSEDGSAITTAHIVGGVLDATVSDKQKQIAAYWLWQSGTLLKHDDLLTKVEYLMGERE